MELALLDIVLCVGILRFVVMDHLNNLQQIILSKLNQTVCQFLHIHRVDSLLPWYLLSTFPLRTVLVTRDWTAVVEG